MKRAWYLAANLAWFSIVGVLPAGAQRQQAPGHSIGSVATEGNLILMTLNEGALGKANLFDLSGRTLRFTPGRDGYRVENRALDWDPEFGAEMAGPQATLHRFAFPFSGKEWESFSVGVTGSIAFGAPQGSPGRGGRGGGVSVERFAQLQEAAPALIGTIPAICVFFKPRMSGARYLKELEDRAVITWNLTEPAGGIQDFTWTPTVNRFQAVLRKDGSIEMSYDQAAARDAIVGVYPLVTAGGEKELAAIPVAEQPGAAPNVDLQSIKLTALDGLFLKVTFTARGPVPPEGDASLAGAEYRVSLAPEGGKPAAVWTIRGGAFGGRGGRGAPRYFASGPGVLPGVTVAGNTISIEGTLPADFQEGERIAVSAGQAPPHTVKLAGIRSPAVDYPP